MENKSDIKIIPYVEVDGMRTFPDRDIMMLYSRLWSSEISKLVFYDGSVTSEKEFLSVMKSNRNHLYIIKLDDQIIGFSWLNGFDMKSAQYHFCTFPEVWGTDKNKDIWKYVVSTILNFKSATGDYYFDLLTGMVPVANFHATAFVKECGIPTAGIIPNAVFNAVSGKSEAGMLFYATRDTFNVGGEHG